MKHFLIMLFTISLSGIEVDNISQEDHIDSSESENIVSHKVSLDKIKKSVIRDHKSSKIMVECVEISESEDDIFECIKDPYKIVKVREEKEL